MWIFFAILDAIFAAIVTIAGKLALKNINPIALVSLRATLMAFITLTIALATNSFEGFSLKTLNSADKTALILASIAGALSWVFYFLALKFTDKTSLVAAIDKSSIILIIIFAIIVLHEKLTIAKFLGGILIFIGVLLVSK